MRTSACFLLFCFFTGASLPSAQPRSWDFESETAGWKAVAKEAAVTQEKGISAPDKGKTALHVRASVISGTNLASSESFPLASKQFFRLTARVRIDRINPKNPLPCLKCEFGLESPGTWLGQAVMEGYDSSRPGTWQRLTVEFRVPYGTERGWLALGFKSREKAALKKSGPADVYLDDIRLEPIAHLTVEGKYILKPFPASLEKVRGMHPRIFLNDRRIAELREAIKTTHAPLWKKILAQANTIAAKAPSPYLTEKEWSNIEQLWQRPVGDNMPFLALAWVMTGDRKYLNAALTWALAACGYKTWGLYEYDGMDLAAGHQLFGLGIVYDWCYRDLDEETRRIIRETIARRGSALFQAAAEGTILKTLDSFAVNPWVEWDEAYLQNHLWNNSCGLAVAGLAVFDEQADASRWIAFTLDKYRITMSLLGDDGASHEGPGYWTYGTEYMLKFMTLARDLLDVDLYNNSWWRNTALYRLYMSLPQHSWTNSNTTVDYGDSPRCDWYGADYQLYRLASEYRDSHAQWLAESLDAANVEHPVARWLDLFWFDPGVSSTPPADLPTLRHFTDIDIVSARSDWSGDESMVFFKCGPYIGHKAIQEFTYCPSSAHHVHPDVGNFMLFGGGDWLIRDDGYRAKHTGYHNTLLVDDGEQFGGGGPIFNGIKPHAFQAQPRIILTSSTPGLDHIVGDATQAYPSEAGLKKFVRYLLFLKPDVLIVADDIELNRHHALELRFHPEQQQGKRDGDAFLMQGKKALLRVDPLTPQGVTVSDPVLETLGKEPGDKPFTLYTIRLQTMRAKWRNAVAFSWSKVTGEPVRVTVQEKGDTWTFTAGGRTVILDWKTGKVQ